MYKNDTVSPLNLKFGKLLFPWLLFVVLSMADRKECVPIIQKIFVVHVSWNLKWILESNFWNSFSVLSALCSLLWNNLLLWRTQQWMVQLKRFQQLFNIKQHNKQSLLLPKPCSPIIANHLFLGKKIHHKFDPLFVLRFCQEQSSLKEMAAFLHTKDEWTLCSCFHPSKMCMTIRPNTKLNFSATNSNSHGKSCRLRGN